MGKKQFKTESKRLLDLMINSIYTNKEIFLRELISNASDAIDKYHFNSLTDKLEKIDYEIKIDFNKDERTITISDTGIGMTEEDLNNNLGTIARSGTKEFMEKLENKKDIETIGQFGVGFYSAFMVADKVEVTTKSPYSDKAYTWSSKGEDTYEIKEASKENTGTDLKLYLRSTDDFDYDNLLDYYTLSSLVEKYSNYIKYPIKMNKETTKEDDVKEIEEVTLNSMKPIWKKAKKDIKEEDMNNFFMTQFHEYSEPMKVIHNNVEGKLTYTSLLFIPNSAPTNLHSKSYEKGLQLFTKGVFIMDKCKELVPEWMLFVKGLVDTSDLDLNISREMLQHSNQLKEIGNAIEKRVKSELTKMLDKDKEAYIKFFKEFGVYLKIGIYESYGAKKDLLQDLILFNTNKRDNITLSEYIKDIKKDQENIFFATGKSPEQIKALPQMDMIKEKDYEVLLLTDDIDEFMINILREYESKEFKSITSNDLDLSTEETKKEVEEKEKTSKNLLESIKTVLDGKVTDVKLSTRLKDSPVCLVSKGNISFEMERILKQMPNSQEVKAERVLELNPNHELFKALEKMYTDDSLTINTYADLLYNQALLIEGLPIEDPIMFSNKMCELMVKASK